MFWTSLSKLFTLCYLPGAFPSNVGWCNIGLLTLGVCAVLAFSQGFLPLLLPLFLLWLHQFAACVIACVMLCSDAVFFFLFLFCSSDMFLLKVPVLRLPFVRPLFSVSLGMPFCETSFSLFPSLLSVKFHFLYLQVFLWDFFNFWHHMIINCFGRMITSPVASNYVIYYYVFSKIMNLIKYVQSWLYIHVCFFTMAWLCLVSLHIIG